MSIWRELFRSGPSGMEQIREQLLSMLDIDRRTFDTACSALLEGADVDTVRSQVSDSDHRVNVLVQQVRRELVVHASTHGSLVEISPLLLYMSIVKDIERIGDYAKNILDIARAGGDLSVPADDRDALRTYRDRVSALISEVRETFAEQDADRATSLLETWQEVGHEFDHHVAALISSDAPSRHAVPRALYYRYLKRIASHLDNILTALVMPLDKVDFYWPDESEH
ncbi:MAG TPA: PhoU domain-containing protein [Euzebyales bacterium]|nr:PhoU domain-containing protein [Euzebyales bacterium]